MLVRLDGAAPAFRLIVVPGESVVLDGQGQPITLAESYAAAGPARAGSLLAATLGIQLDRYLAATPAVWGQSLSRPWSRRGSTSLPCWTKPRAGFGGGRRGSAGVQAKPPPSYRGRLSPARRWGGCGRRFGRRSPCNARGSLAESVPQGLRRCSGDLLTDLTALDLEELGRVLAQLADASCSPQADLLPGRWDERTARYELEEDALTLAQALFPLAPQEAETN